MTSGWPPIPGETPIDDISGLRLPGVRTRSQCNHAEAENIAKAAVKYLAAPPSARVAPFTDAWMMRLHREMFGDVWKWAGALRRGEKNLGSPPALIAQQLHALAQDVEFWSDPIVDPAATVARLHHRAVSIHPFENGNGRWARMLAAIWLRRHRLPALHWPEPDTGIVSPIRDEYLAALRHADGGDESLLIDLHRRFMREPHAA